MNYYTNTNHNRVYTGIKSIIDIVTALILSVLLFPVFLLVVVILMLSGESRIFFIQQRPGQNEKLFKLIKFKTMSDSTDATGKLLPDQERLTAVGQWLRKFSLDELPQLINVIKGEMSFVGPRPLLVQYLNLYNERQRRRHLVKPGITGWAQVNGRNTVSWQDRFEMDGWYVDNISFWIDIKILFITIFKVLKSDGVSSTSSPTMENFTGNKVQ